MEIEHEEMEHIHEAEEEFKIIEEENTLELEEMHEQTEFEEQ